jgi:hypothetical protein
MTLCQMAVGQIQPQFESHLFLGPLSPSACFYCIGHRVHLGHEGTHHMPWLSVAGKLRNDIQRPDNFALLAPFWPKFCFAVHKNHDKPPIGLWDVKDPTLSRQSAHRWWQGCQPYAPAALHSSETFLLFCFWYSFLLYFTNIWQVPVNIRSFPLSLQKNSGIVTSQRLLSPSESLCTSFTKIISSPWALSEFISAIRLETCIP